jgi:hypothetical protein
LLAAGEFCGAFFAPEMLTALFQVVMIDLVLAGDNAIVIGLSAAGLPGAQRSKAVLIGRRHFAPTRICVSHRSAVANRGFVAGGWYLAALGVLENVARAARLQVAGFPVGQLKSTAAAGSFEIARSSFVANSRRRRVSMSLDNVLAVAGAARDHPYILTFRPRTFNRANGRRSTVHCPPFGPAPLDRLCRSCDHFLCRRRDDLSRQHGSVAARAGLN